MNTFQQIVFACALTLLSHLGSMIAKAHFLLFLSFFLGGGVVLYFVVYIQKYVCRATFFPQNIILKKN